MIALTAVPLASLIAIAPSAKAGAVTNLVLNPAACNVSFSGSNFNSSGCSTAALPMGSNGVTGVKLFGFGSVSSPFISGGGVQFIGLGFSSNGTTNNGSFGGGTIPIAWSFTIGDNAAQPDIEWSLAVSINGSSVFSQNFSTAPGLIQGSTVTNVLPPIGNITSWGVNFTVTDDEAVNGETLTVSVPANSVDLNAAQVAATPEPGTFAMLGSALAGLGAFAWRRRQGVNR